MIFFISNTKLCPINKMLLKIREAALLGVDYLYLRENHLDDSDYYQLGLSILQVLTHTSMELVICHRPHIARKLGLKQHARFHERTKEAFSVSTHTLYEVKSVETFPYFFYGNVFETKCKKGVKAKSVSPLIYYQNIIALGGITKENVKKLPSEVRHIGIMSEWLETDNIASLVNYYKSLGY